jgi:hypothetical protein
VGLRDRETDTAADGSFTLRGLPRERIRLLALYGRDQQAEASVIAGERGVVLAARPRRPLRPDEQREFAVEVVRQAWQADQDGARDRVSGLFVLAQVDPLGVVEALTALDPKADDHTDAIATGMLALAGRAPAVCVEHLALLDRIAEPEARRQARAQVGSLLTGTHRAAAVRLFGLVRAAPPGEDIDFDLTRAALAGRLAKPQAVTWADAALKEGSSHQALTAAYEWADLPALRDRALQAVAAVKRPVGELLSAVGLLWQVGPQAALARFEQVWTPTAARFWASSPKREQALGELLQRLVLGVAPTDPPAAGRLAALAPVESRGALYALAAAATNDRALARKLIGEAIASSEHLSGAAEAHVVVTALAVDPTLAEPAAVAYLRGRDDVAGECDVLTVLAAREPNRARKLLERAVAAEPERPVRVLVEPNQLLAACGIDLERARELALAGCLAGDRADRLHAIARWLACPPALRVSDEEWLEVLAQGELDVKATLKALD